MNKIFSILRFLRITDENNQISLTNLAMAASTISMFIRPEAGIADVSAMVATIVGYNAKRWINGKTSEQDSTALADAVAKLETKVAGLQLGQQVSKR